MQSTLNLMSTTPREEVLLTSGQAAQFLRLSQATVLRWSTAGRIPCVRTGAGHRRFRLGDLEVILSNGGFNAARAIPEKSGEADSQVG